MGSSRNALGLALALLLAGCSAGVGEGYVTGPFWAPDCSLDGEVVDLRPDFFSADPFEDELDIRIQRGSDWEVRSNGLSISVRSASEVKARLGTPIDLADPVSMPPAPLEERPLARMTIFLNQRCDEEDRLPVAYVATEGELTFDAIYAQRVSRAELETAGRFADVLFVDPAAPEERRAILSGEFRFLFNRGRPAQRFP